MASQGKCGFTRGHEAVVEILTWENFSTAIQRSGPSPAYMGGSRGVLLGYSPTDGRMWLRIPCTSAELAPRVAFSELAIDVRTSEGQRFLEVSTTSSTYFRELHGLASIVTREMEKVGAAAPNVLMEALKRWRQFTAAKALLTTDQQTGLVGELLLLRAHIGLVGAAGLDAWTANRFDIPQRHDFRLKLADVEVKTTVKTKREHVIHGVGQLMPAPGRRLYLLSVKLELAGQGSGFSLPQLATEVRAMIGAERSTAEFDESLERANFLEADGQFYSAYYRLADRCRLVPVDESVPALTDSVLEHVFGSARAARLSHLSYSLDVDGLGFCFGDTEFENVLGAIEI